MENLELRVVRKEAQYYLLKSMAVVTGDKMIEFEAGLINAELKEEYQEEGDDMSMNEFIDYIELTLNTPGSINPEKMSAGRAYSLFNRAKEINKRNKDRLRKSKR